SQAPPPRRGGRADQENGTLPPFGAAGEVKHTPRRVTDLPHCALLKVALHLFEVRSDPSSKEPVLVFATASRREGTFGDCTAACKIDLFRQVALSNRRRQF